VNYAAADMLELAKSGNNVSATPTSMDEMSKNAEIVSAEIAANQSHKRKFVPASTSSSDGNVDSSAAPGEIDIDDVVMDWNPSSKRRTEFEVKEKSVPAAVFGHLK
jgi:hypothetical protein